jgi:CMP/dCMP kinase
LIISICGMPGSGKSTVAKLLCKKLKYKHYSAGDFRRMMAEKRGISIADLNKLGENESFTDNEVDDFQKELGKKQDNFVIDGRLSWHFIPHSLKVFLCGDLEIRAKRIMHEKREKESFKSIEEAKNKISEREKSDEKRYEKYYGVDYTDKKNYDLVIDTTKIPAEEVVFKILEFAKKKQ